MSTIFYKWEDGSHTKIIRHNIIRHVAVAEMDTHVDGKVTCACTKVQKTISTTDQDRGPGQKITVLQCIIYGSEGTYIVYNLVG